MDCRECGASNLDGAESCSACGTLLSQSHDERPSVASPSGRSWLLIGVVVAAGLAVVGLMISAGGGGSGGGGGAGLAGQATLDSFSSDSTATVAAVTSEATQTLELYQTKDYTGVYGQLASSDRAQVSQDDWLARSARVESTLGTMTAYTVGKLWYLDPDHSVVAAEIAASFDQVPETVNTMWYFIMENGSVTRTMMWGKEATLTLEPIQ